MTNCILSLKKIQLKIVLLMLILFSVCIAKAQENNLPYYLSRAPFAMPVISVPQFPADTFNIINYGAVGNGHVLNTDAIHNAISACAAKGGGTVIVPPGLWLTGPVQLQSNINLHLQRGAVILFSPDHTLYPIIRTSGKSHTYFVMSPFYGYGLNNIAITGDGIADGAGDTWRPVKKEKMTAGQWKNLIASGGVVSEDGNMWWPTKEAMEGENYLKQLKKNKNDLMANDYLPARDFLRPYMVSFINCKHILLQGTTFKNSPKFSLYPKNCSDIIIRNVKINNEWYAQNGDGIDISACKNVIIYKCTVNAGDDGICMKSSSSKDGKAALQNIIIADCVVYHAHGGFVIGSNTDGGMQNIFVDNCNFIGTDVGIRIKSRRGSGGLVHNVFIKNIFMANIANEAILFSTYYEEKLKEIDTASQPVTATTPQFRDFDIDSVYGVGAKNAISISGLPEMPVNHIYFSHINLSAEKGFSAVNANNIQLTDVKVHSQKGPAYSGEYCSDININGKIFSGAFKE